MERTFPGIFLPDVLGKAKREKVGHDLNRTARPPQQILVDPAKPGDLPLQVRRLAAQGIDATLGFVRNRSRTFADNHLVIDSAKLSAQDFETSRETLEAQEIEIHHCVGTLPELLRHQTHG
jgi:hypothetical protein